MIIQWVFFLLASAVVFVKGAVKDLFDIFQFPGAVVLFYLCLAEGCKGLRPERSVSEPEVPTPHPSHAPTTLHILWSFPLPLILDGPSGACFHMQSSALCVTLTAFHLRSGFLSSFLWLCSTISTRPPRRSIWPVHSSSQPFTTRGSHQPHLPWPLPPIRSRHRIVSQQHNRPSLRFILLMFSRHTPILPTWPMYLR